MVPTSRLLLPDFTFSLDRPISPQAVTAAPWSLNQPIGGGNTWHAMVNMQKEQKEQRKIRLAMVFKGVLYRKCALGEWRSYHSNTQALR